MTDAYHAGSALEAEAALLALAKELDRAVPNQRHRRGGAGARVNGFDAHGVGHLLAVTVPTEVEFGWDAGGFEVGVSCHRVPIPAGSTTFTRAVDL